MVGGVFQQWRQRHERQATFWMFCTAVTPRNEEHLDQLIRADWRITTRVLCKELNIGFSVLETMVAPLEYRKVYTRWVPQMLKQEQNTVCKFVRAY